MGDMAGHDLFVPALLPPLKCGPCSVHLSQGKADGHCTKFPVTLQCVPHCESMKPELQSSV